MIVFFLQDYLNYLIKDIIVSIQISIYKFHNYNEIQTIIFLRGFRKPRFILYFEKMIVK